MRRKGPNRHGRGFPYCVWRGIDRCSPEWGVSRCGLACARGPAGGGTLTRHKGLRADVGDPDLDFYPASAMDDIDAADAVRYLRSHRRVWPDVLAAELPDRSRLIKYQHQRDTLADE
jgi:hypothetical protein